VVAPLAATVPDSLLAVLKVIFLLLLYLFFFRVVRAVWIELREPKMVHAPPGVAGAAGMPPPPPAAVVRAGRRGRHPKVERLVIVEPTERKGQEFPLGDELTVGRATGCGVSLPEDTFISQVHARVFRRDGKLYVEDLGSTNGTYLNRRAVSAPAAIGKGDRLQVGRTVLEMSK